MTLIGQRFESRIWTQFGSTTKSGLRTGRSQAANTKLALLSTNDARRPVTDDLEGSVVSYGIEALFLIVSGRFYFFAKAQFHRRSAGWAIDIQCNLHTRNHRVSIETARPLPMVRESSNADPFADYNPLSVGRRRGDKADLTVTISGMAVPLLSK
jgi:hypothetical protein